MAGLLGAATVNPLMARQFANARQNVTAPTSVMDERYPAWKKSQDQATQFLLAADLIGSAVPAGLLAAPAMKKGLLSMGETVAPKMENYMARQGLLQPITAYQGSPHKYDPEKLVRLANGETAYVGGKFNALKEPPPGSTVLEDFPLGRIRSEAIGTGEGAQAYGHGSYLAESPGVAREYQKKLSKSVTVDGKKLQSIPSDGPDAQAYHSVITGIQNNLDPQKAIDEAAKYWQDAANEMRGFLKTNPELAQRINQEVASREAIVNEVRKLKAESFYMDPGHLYTVDLPDPMIAKMLDWDKPLSQQAPEVQKALQIAAEARAKQTGGAFGPLDMSQFGRDVVPTLGEGRLKQAGIPGIRYLDGGSRGAGAGTSNFVVFPGNEQLVKILSRE